MAWMTTATESKLKSIEFIHGMFEKRGYCVDPGVLVTLYDPRQDLWQIQTRTSQGDRVVALLADGKVFGHAGQMLITPADLPVQYSIVESPTDSPSLPTSTSKNAGTDYIKSIVKFAQAHHIKEVILVTDFMTPQASKLMLKVDGVRMSHFSYDQTCIGDFTKHITQPLKFQALVGEARAAFVARHPHWSALTRYSRDDILVKYFGLNVGDIVYIEDRDRQSGLVQEYGLVVEPPPPST